MQHNHKYKGLGLYKIQLMEKYSSGETINLNAFTNNRSKLKETIEVDKFSSLYYIVLNYITDFLASYGLHSNILLQLTNAKDLTSSK